MKRFNCPVIDKKICIYDMDENVLVSEYCPRCNLPNLYMGIRPNVPESHCEAARISIKGKEYPVPEAPKPKDDAPYYMDELYHYLNDRSDVFKKMALDERGRLMCELKKTLDKFNVK